MKTLIIAGLMLLLGGAARADAQWYECEGQWKPPYEIFFYSDRSGTFCAKTRERARIQLLTKLLNKIKDTIKKGDPMPELASFSCAPSHSACVE